MSILCFVICVLLLLFNVMRKMKIYNPSIIFYGLWSVILIFNLLNLYGMNKAGNETYFLILIGLIAFFGGTVIESIIEAHNIHFKIGKFKTRKSVEINYKFIYILSVIVIILYLIDFVIALQYLFSGYSLSQLRAWTAETFENAVNPITSRRSFIEQTFRVVIVAPFVSALLPISLIDFFENSSGKKNLIKLEILITIMDMITGGGARLGVLRLIILVVVVASVYKNKLKAFEKNINKKTVILGIAGLGIIIFFTTHRSSHSIFEEIYYYFGLCVPLLDYWLPYLQNSGHTYGILFLFGIIRIPFMVMEKIGVGNFELYHLAQSYILQANQFKNVGARRANSFVSPFYYFYADAGILGIILGMMFFGFVAEKYFMRVQKNNSMQDMFIFLLIVRGIVYTFIRWDFIATNYAMAFLFVCIFFRKKT